MFRIMIEYQGGNFIFVQRIINHITNIYRKALRLFGYNRKSIQSYCVFFICKIEHGLFAVTAQAGLIDFSFFVKTFHAQDQNTAFFYIAFFQKMDKLSCRFKILLFLCLENFCLYEHKNYIDEKKI